MSPAATGLPTPSVTKHERVFLSKIGLDERWLQEQINDDPSILGLGDLEVFAKEKSQPLGGRVDFLLLDPDSEPETMYEVEIMRGATDESHIIRTIEYWDVETRRYPNREHRAVIVAEEIKNRFFNVIWLLSRSIPIIAIQLHAIQVDGKLLLHFTKVLDLFERADEDEPNPADRTTWEKRAPLGMELFSRIVAILEKEDLHVKPNYRNDFIGLNGNTSRNIVSLKPRKEGTCRLRFGKLRATSKSDNDAVREAWQQEKADLTQLANEKFSIELSQPFVDQHEKFIADQIKHVFEICDRA